MTMLDPVSLSLASASMVPPFEATGPLMTLLEHGDALIALYDPHGQIRYANRAYRETFFLEQGDAIDWIGLMRRNHAYRRGPVVAQEDFEGWLSSCLSRRGKTPVLSIETDLYDGRWLWIVETTAPDGHILFVALDITRQRQGERLLRQERDIALKIASIDALTGVSNRAHIMRLLDEALLDRARTMAVAIVDIDHFKRINDRFGHAVGDTVLRQFAQVIRAEIRTCDGFGRIGGEEFMILFPGSSLYSIETTMARLRRRVRGEAMIAEQPDYRVGFSAGLTMIQPEDTSAAVYARADAALYAAKFAGRGRLRLAG